MKGRFAQRILTLMAFGCLWFQLLGTGTSEARTYLVDFDENQAVALMLQSINEIRYQRGLKILALDASLSEVCRRHAIDMAYRNYFDHITPEGLNPRDRVRIAGLPYEVAENIGIIRTFNNKTGDGYGVKQVVDSLMRKFLSSPDHLANILDPEFTHIGIGFFQDVDNRNDRLKLSDSEEGLEIGYGTILVVQEFFKEQVRIVEPYPFDGVAKEGEFLQLKLQFSEKVEEAFLRIKPLRDDMETSFDVPLLKKDNAFEARFKMDIPGVFSVTIYANSISKDWFYKQQGKLELRIKPVSH